MTLHLLRFTHHALRPKKRSLRPYIPCPVILAPQVMTSHHRGVNAGIQSFELKDWMPIPVFTGTSFHEERLNPAGMTDNRLRAFFSSSELALSKGQVLAARQTTVFVLLPAAARARRITGKSS